MRLSDLAAMVRSKNAGPFGLTFDVMFTDEDNYNRVKRSGALNAEMFASLYHTTPDKVKFYECDSAKAFKFSIPHPTTQGALGASDLHGGQQYSPLLDVDIT